MNRLTKASAVALARSISAASCSLLGVLSIAAVVMRFPSLVWRCRAVIVRRATICTAASDIEALILEVEVAANPYPDFVADRAAAAEVDESLALGLEQLAA